jgi:hypothetical protein
MAEGDLLPDDAVVVRGGVPPFRVRPLHTACDQHPAGYHGFSVQSAAGLTIEQLATECPNKTVGFTTAGEIRKMGYDVRETSGDGHHATVVVPKPWEPDAAEQLAQTFRPANNPSPKRRP